jgi:hypothetical protein
MAPLPATFGIHDMDMIASYLYQLFKAKISHVGDGGSAAASAAAAAAVFPPDHLSLDASIDCEHLSTILATAYLTPSACFFVLPLRLDSISYSSPVRLPWSTVDYCRHLPSRPSGFSGPTEDHLEALFPPLNVRPFPTVNIPCHIVDSDGLFLYWYLPDCLTATRQVPS